MVAIVPYGVLALIIYLVDLNVVSYRLLYFHRHTSSHSISQLAATGSADRTKCLSPALTQNTSLHSCPLRPAPTALSCAADTPPTGPPVPLPSPQQAPHSSLAHTLPHPLAVVVQDHPGFQHAVLLRTPVHLPPLLP